jgi:hypothetical protein
LRTSGGDANASSIAVHCVATTYIHAPATTRAASSLDAQAVASSNGDVSTGAAIHASSVASKNFDEATRDICTIHGRCSEAHVPAGVYLEPIL